MLEKKDESQSPAKPRFKAGFKSGFFSCFCLFVIIIGVPLLMSVEAQGGFQAKLDQLIDFGKYYFNPSQQTYQTGVGLNLTKEQEEIDEVQRLVDASGIPQRPYVEGQYVCGNYAQDMYDYLTSASSGFSDTWHVEMVVIFGLGGKTDGSDGHALNVLFLSDGRMLFLEPQMAQILNGLSANIYDPLTGSEELNIAGQGKWLTWDGNHDRLLEFNTANPSLYIKIDGEVHMSGGSTWEKLWNNNLVSKDGQYLIVIGTPVQTG